MSRLARLLVMAAFALAALSQPLALDACSVSCEAARAARAPAVAAPCHHTTSCATQISQPTSPGSTFAKAVVAPPAISVELRHITLVAAVQPSYIAPISSSPPAPLRL